MPECTIFQDGGRGDSQFWSGLMKVKQYFLGMGTFKLGNGSQIRLWEDAWFGDLAFKDQYPSLYNIVRKKSASVKVVFRSNPLNVSLRRSLVGNNLAAWHHLVARVASFDTFMFIFRKNIYQRCIISSQYPKPGPSSSYQI